MRILTDDDIDRLPLAPMISAVRAHIAADATGQTIAPPRHVVNFDAGALLFTIGGDRNLAGFRVYQTFAKPGHPHDDQIVAAWDRRTGEMIGLALGNRLGALRTAIIGAVAAGALAPVNARTLCVVGAGRQAETQILAVSGTRSFDEIRIAGRRPEAAAALAAKLAGRVRAPLVPLADARAAVEEADVVILATASEQPVIDPAWIAPHAYVATLGPKSKQNHELPLELARRARTIATDSPQQIARMGDTHMLHGTPDYDRIRHLGLFADEGTEPPEGPALFLSIGLAGTEVACLAAALDATA